MSKPIKLTTPRFRVVLGDPDDSDSWVEHHVQAIGADLTLAEEQFKRHGWGAITERPLKWQGMVAWFALRRVGAITEPWETFEHAYLEVSSDGDDDVTPTEPVSAAG